MTSSRLRWAWFFNWVACNYGLNNMNAAFESSPPNYDIIVIIIISYRGWPLLFLSTRDWRKSAFFLGTIFRRGLINSTVYDGLTQNIHCSEGTSHPVQHNAQKNKLYRQYFANFGLFYLIRQPRRDKKAGTTGRSRTRVSSARTQPRHQASTGGCLGPWVPLIRGVHLLGEQPGWPQPWPFDALPHFFLQFVFVLAHYVLS